eukprot:3804509-Ditylum_brightwellii.AAC.1
MPVWAVHFSRCGPFRPVLGRSTQPTQALPRVAGKRVLGWQCVHGNGRAPAAWSEGPASKAP